MTSQSQTPAATPGRSVAPFFAPLQREFDRVLAEFGSFDMADMFGPSPRMDLRETDQGVELTVEVPGLSQDDLRIEVDGDILTVSGEKKTAAETEEKGFRITERRHGRFSRSVRLPAAVEPDKVRASLAQGVLTVTAAVDGADRDRKVQIPIKAG